MTILTVIHRVPKKASTVAYSRHNFSKYWPIVEILLQFYCHNLQEICIKAIIKYPTTLQTRRYTTL